MHATGDRPGQGVRRQRADLQHRQFTAALNLALPGGQGEHDVAIKRAVQRADGARHAVLRHDGHPFQLHPRQRQIGGDAGQGGVLSAALRLLFHPVFALRTQLRQRRCAAVAEFTVNFIGVAQKARVPGATTAPKLLTATSAPTVAPLVAMIDAEPRPPFSLPMPVMAP